MTPVLSIRPSKDIRTNYQQISALAKEGPVAITVNGKEDTVLLSHEEYKRQQVYLAELEAQLKLYAKLAQAMDDVKLGRTVDANSAFDDVLRDLEQMKL